MEHKKRMFSGALFATGFLLPALSLTAAIPTVEQTNLQFHQGNTKATISYELENAPAVITLDIETNTLADASGEWVSIGGENLQTLSGDVHKVITPGAGKKIVWQSRVEWPDKKVPAGQIRAVLTAWATNAPPDYMVIGLDSENDVKLYAGPDFVPYGIDSDYYKTNAILMRKIPAAGVVWRMGSFEDEDPDRADYEVPHLVMLTADYYLGVYELTQGQLMKFHDKNPSHFQGESYPDYPMRPVDTLLMGDVRGWGDSYWPAGSYDTVHKDSVIKKLRDKCGLKVDLPTEAQWEYACRAGTDTAFNNGTSSSKENIGAVGWYTWNSSTNGVKQTHVVGTRSKNNWGLYDMHGNVTEICLGRANEDMSIDLNLPSDSDKYGVTVDPIGAPIEYANDKHVITKGGAWDRAYHECRSACRLYYSYNWASQNNTGIRIYAPAVFR